MCSHNSERVIQDLALSPGEFTFGTRHHRMRTLLGSCVAVTFWHPGRLIGAMCHYLLPDRPARSGTRTDGRYASDAIGAIARHFRGLGLPASSVEVKMFGGGNMFPGHAMGVNFPVGQRNIQRGRELLQEFGFTIRREDLSGDTLRLVVFEVWTGTVWVRRCVMPAGPREHFRR